MGDVLFWIAVTLLFLVAVVGIGYGLYLMS